MPNLAQIALTATTTSTQPAGGGIESTIYMVVMIALVFGVMWLLVIRPQKKKEKKLREQVNAMAVGDTIVTIGGVVGKVVNLKDDEVTISSSVANTLMTFKKSAINTIQKPISE